MFFTKKKNVPAIHSILDEERKKAKSDVFYYPLLDKDVNSAGTWCAKHHYTMTVSYLRE